MAAIPPVTIQIDLRPTVLRLDAVALEPGDIIVATCRHDTDNQEIAEITDVLNHLFPGHRVIVTAGVEISVKRPKESTS